MACADITLRIRRLPTLLDVLYVYYVAYVPQRLTEDLERDLERHRLYLRDKASRSKEQAHAELRQAQELAQQRLLELQQRHMRHVDGLQSEHEQEVSLLTCCVAYQKAAITA
jgi:hypothetical protein